MKKIFIYEPAMCCATGLCGVSVDPELLRVSTVINSLKKRGIQVERFNLSNAPQEFVKNAEISRLLAEKGVEALPATVVEGKIVKTAAYPTNIEIAAFLEVPESYLSEAEKPGKGGCCCKGGCC